MKHMRQTKTGKPINTYKQEKQDKHEKQGKRETQKQHDKTRTAGKNKTKKRSLSQSVQHWFNKNSGDSTHVFKSSSNSSKNVKKNPKAFHGFHMFCSKIVQNGSK